MQPIRCLEDILLWFDEWQFTRRLVYIPSSPVLLFFTAITGYNP